MKKIQLINDDFQGHVDIIRHACRGIVIKDGKVLLSYETTYADCCERELLEETGVAVKANDCYLEIEELFENWQHIQHYFVCDYVEDTGRQNLTEAEIKCGDEPRWMPLDEALEMFGDYERFHNTAIEDYGLYRREYNALKIMKEMVIRK